MVSPLTCTARTVESRPHATGPSNEHRCRQLAETGGLLPSGPMVQPILGNEDRLISHRKFHSGASASSPFGNPGPPVCTPTAFSMLSPTYSRMSFNR